MVNEHKYTISNSKLKTFKIFQQAFYIFPTHRVLAMYLVVG